MLGVEDTDTVWVFHTDTVPFPMEMLSAVTDCTTAPEERTGLAVFHLNSGTFCTMATLLVTPGLSTGYDSTSS